MVHHLMRLLAGEVRHDMRLGSSYGACTDLNIGHCVPVGLVFRQYFCRRDLGYHHELVV